MSCFDTLGHGWLVKFIEHRVGDRRVVRLIQKWLRAGVLEDGKLTLSEVGTVQGGSISPLLANVYLHYVFDMWVQRRRQRQARGDVIVVRSADDFVAGFQHREEAERFLSELRERLAEFGLELHADKARLVEFGRYAAKNRHDRGDGKPETFNFLWRVGKLWWRVLRRRSQNNRLTWERMGATFADGCRRSISVILIHWSACAPRPKVGAGCGNAARPDLGRGPLVTTVPTPSSYGTFPGSGSAAPLTSSSVSTPKKR